MLVGVMTALLQEIISVYPLLNPSQLTAAASNRVCNALALLQCVASHNETRTLFLNGMWPNDNNISFPHSAWLNFLFLNSSHPSFSLSVPEHYLQVAPVRISPTYFLGRDRRLGEK